MTTESAFRIAFWVLLAGVLVMRAYFSLQVRQAGERLLPDREAAEREGLGMFLARVVLFVPFMALLALYGFNSPWLRPFSIPLASWLRWAGFALGLVSLAFWTWAQVELGKEWSAQLQLREEHRLVTTGPYARIRHPIYSANIGYGLAHALVTANWIFVVLAAVVILGFLYRVPREERMMLDEFGEEYQAYIQRMGRFFPK